MHRFAVGLVAATHFLFADPQTIEIAQAREQQFLGVFPKRASVLSPRARAAYRYWLEADLIDDPNLSAMMRWAALQYAEDAGLIESEYDRDRARISLWHQLKGRAVNGKEAPS